MQGVVRVPLEGGGVIFFEAVPDVDGPVKAGRVADTVRDLPHTLQECLGAAEETARAVLTQLRQAGPAEAEVEFGVSLSAHSGAVIAKGEAAVHLKVRLLWRKATSEDDDE